MPEGAMRIIYSIVTATIIFVAVNVPALANGLAFDQGREGEITAAPICGTLVNRSNQTIMGTMATASQQIQSGDTVRHRENFRLDAGESEKFCTTGPFFQGRRLELIIRTIIPLFDCKTRIDQTIYLDAVYEDGMTKLSASCY